jgi:hypothetical protein
MHVSRKQLEERIHAYWKSDFAQEQEKDMFVMIRPHIFFLYQGIWVMMRYNSEWIKNNHPDTYRYIKRITGNICECV